MVGVPSLPWRDFESWKDYGIEHGYNERNKTSLQKSRNKQERSWYFNGYRKGWNNEFDFNSKNRVSGYLKVWINLETEFRLVIKELGHFPTQRELLQSGNSSLSAAAIAYHVGLNSVRRKMGYDTLEMDKDYWKNFSNIENELKELEKKLGRLPTYSELESLGRHDLLSGMQKYHGGYNSVRRRLNRTSCIGQDSKRISIECINRIISLLKESSHTNVGIASIIGCSNSTVWQYAQIATKNGKLDPGYLRPNGVLYLENIRTESAKGLEDCLARE